MGMHKLDLAMRGGKLGTLVSGTMESSQEETELYSYKGTSKTNL